MNRSPPHDAGATFALVSALRLGAAPGLFDWMLATFEACIEQSRARAELAQLDDQLLRDIGLTRWQVACETEKFFWQR